MSKLLYQATFDNIHNFDLDNNDKLLLIKECVESGMDIDRKISLYLYLAITAKHRDTINYLISVINIERITEETFRNICHQNDLETMEMLLEMGVDPNINRHMLPSVEMLKLLMRYGFDPFVNSNKLLWNACYWGRIELAKYLINIGANCDKFSSFGPNVENKLEITKLLLDTETNIEGLLKYAFRKADFDICRLLLEHNVNISGCKFVSKLNEDTDQMLIDLFTEYGHDIRDLINK